MESGLVIIFSHILPLIIGFFSILLIINGVLDEQKHITVFGVLLFIFASLAPFVILPIYFGV